MDDKPIWSAPSPNFGDYIMPGRTHRTPAVMCANLQPSRPFLNLDRLILPAWMFTAVTCIRTCPNDYIQRLLSTTPAPSAAPRKSQVLPAPPATPTCLASIPGDNTDHSWTDVLQAGKFYCSPSGLSELLPARRISSVDNRLTAITELRHHRMQWKGVCDFESKSTSRMNEKKERSGAHEP
jgi:hypothetical protein